MKTLTTIGSLPYKESEIACEKILKYTPELPAWPQLPKRNFKENMYVQYSENFPGIILDETNQKIFVSTDKFYAELENFYKNYIDFNIDFFKISHNFAFGIYDLKKTINKNSKIKAQTTGPVTFGLSLKDETGKSIFYIEQMRDIVIKNCIMKSLWQLNFFENNNLKVIFLDEPYLATYGSAFSGISKNDIIESINNVIKGIRENYKNDLLIGVHCCANTDWSILLQTDIDILSFDAYEFFDNFILYTDAIKNFIEKDNILAWGIVPTQESTVKNVSIESLIEKFNKDIKLLLDKGFKKEKLLNNIIITPSCGLGTVTEETSEYVLQLTSEFINYI